MDDNSYISAFLKFLMSERGVSTNTSDSYRHDLSALMKFFQPRKLRLTDATVDDLRDYVRHMNKKMYNPSTIARRVSCIRGLYKFLYSDRIIAGDPSVDLSSCRLRRTLPRVIGVKEIGRMLNTAKSDDSAEGKRIAAIVNVLYSSGVRISELIHLGFYEICSMLRENTADIAHIVIKGKGGRERLILFNEIAMESIKAYLDVRKSFIVQEKSESRWLFPGAKFDQCISRQRVGQLLKRLASLAGVDPDKVSPHKFRHSFATHLLNNGSNIVFIQKMLGHVNLSATQIYTHVASNKMHEVLSKHHPFSKLTAGN